MKADKIYNIIVYIAALASSYGVGAVQNVHGQIVCVFIALVLMGSQGIFWLHDKLISRERTVYLLAKDEPK